MTPKLRLPGDPQARLCASANLPPVHRLLLVERIRCGRWKVTVAVQAAGVSRTTANEWLRRVDAEGPAGLRDHCSRAPRIQTRTPQRLVRRIEQRQPKAGWEIAQQLGLPVSTVSWPPRRHAAQAPRLGPQPSAETIAIGCRH
ncbi:MAG: helix-turn-helix domain-containing protein [Proteobacteria bacterium]|nr:helix-turn-helix domain-containing protein [Pseudomonadota bacterium]